MTNIEDQAYDEIHQINLSDSWSMDSVMPWDGGDFGQIISRTYFNSRFLKKPKDIQDASFNYLQMCKEFLKIIKPQFSNEVQECYNFTVEYEEYNNVGRLLFSMIKKTDAEILLLKNKKSLKLKIKNS